MNSSFCCPVCAQPLSYDVKTYKCGNNHCFDISKYGTVNLLLSRASSSKRHGDDTLMVLARRDFLNSGAYERFAKLIAQKTVDLCKAENPILADIGCGEGYYTEIVANMLDESEKNCRVCGVDISKDALRYAKKRLKKAEFAVGSAYKLPLPDKSCDIMLNIFAPYNADEMARTVADDGIVVRAFARQNHLIGLKKVLYDEVRNDDVDDISLDGFELIEQTELEYELTLDNQKIIGDLFKMTPYYYKSSKDSQQRLNNVQNLTTLVHFTVAIYKKHIT